MAEYREIHCPYGDDFEGGDECDRCEQYELCMETYPPVNLIEIPKGATRADVFKIVFGYAPNKDSIICNENDWCGENEACEYCISNSKRVGKEEEWWNAPYESKVLEILDIMESEE